MNLSARECSVLEAVQHHVDIRAVTLWEFAAGAPRSHGISHVASAPHARDALLHVVFSLASLSPHLFITVTDGEPEAVARVLADLEAYDVPPRLAHGHTVPMESTYLAENGRVGVVLLRPVVSNALSHMPDELVAGEQRLHCLLVLFLSREEFDLKRREGLDELLGYFEDIGRDVTALQA